MGAGTSLRPPLPHSERKATYRDAGLPGDARYTLHALEAHGPRGTRDTLYAAGAVGTLDAFWAQLPTIAGLGRDNRTRWVGAATCSCHPASEERGWRRPAGRAGPAPLPLSSDWPLLTSPLGPTGPLAPCKRDGSILMTHMLPRS